MSINVVRLALPALALTVLAACSPVAGLDPTGATSMVAFEAQRQQSMRMQEQYFSPEKMEQLKQNAIAFCRDNPTNDDCVRFHQQMGSKG